jgi:zinc transporter ZupT
MFEIGPLLGALLICAVYAAGGLTKPLAHGFGRKWTSFAAGVSVAYVFEEILPELEVQKQSFIGSMVERPLFAEKRVYVFALLGFVLFAGLEHIRRRLRAPRSGSRWPDAYNLGHLAAMGLYNVVIGYLLAGRAEPNPEEHPERSVAAYVLAMSLHVMILDHQLSEAHSWVYERWGRSWLAGCVLGGWFLGTTEHLSEAAFSRLFAVIAGGVVFTSANEELPTDSAGRFLWFVLGAALYGGILLVT